MNSYSKRRSISLAATLLLLIALHLFLPATTGLWLETFFDWSHVPVFALIAISLFQSLDSWRSDVNKAIFAFSGTVIFGILSEAAQIPTSRDASWADILSNITGATIGLIAISTFTRPTHIDFASRTIAIALLCVSCLPAFQVSADYLERNRAIPVIYNSIWLE